MRISLGNAAILLISFFEFAGILLCNFLVGLDFWIPVQMVLIYTAASFRGFGASSNFTLCNAILGLDFTIYLVGFPAWPSALIGVIAIATIFLHFQSSGNTETSPGGESLA